MLESIQCPLKRDFFPFPPLFEHYMISLLYKDHFYWYLGILQTSKYTDPFEHCIKSIVRTKLQCILWFLYSNTSHSPNINNAFSLVLCPSFPRKNIIHTKIRYYFACRAKIEQTPLFSVGNKHETRVPPSPCPKTICMKYSFTLIICWEHSFAATRH